MIDLKKITSLRKATPTSLLGLALDGSRLDAVWLKRGNVGLQVAGTLSVTLTLDPLTAAPELVGREIRNHLDAAEIRERRCVVALPLKWALVAQTKLPPLNEADVAGFLQLEAERSFPCDVATLVTATSRCQTGAGEEIATFIGMPRGHVTALETTLRAAGLKPDSFSLGITALQRPTADAALALLIGETHVGLQITYGGGVLLLRALEGAIDNTGGRVALHADVVAREVRITLGQLPEPVRQALKAVRIFGPTAPATELATELQRRMPGSNWKLEVVSRCAPEEVSAGLPKDTPGSAALSLAAEVLTGQPVRFDFLPPKVSTYQQFMSRYGTGKLRKVSLVAGGVVAVVVAAFLIQQFMLWRLESRWSAIKTEVEELEIVQNKIKQFRPWYDESARTLSIFRALTQAFPEDGAVTAKSVEIREQNRVTCTGTARDYAALLLMQKKLGDSGTVADLKLSRIQGKAPTMQFTFDFRWIEGGGKSAN
jgi:hypothetical protein